MSVNVYSQEIRQTKQVENNTKFTLSLGVEIQLIKFGNAELSNLRNQEEFGNKLTGLILELKFPSMMVSTKDNSFSVKAFEITSQIYAKNAKNERIHPFIISKISL